MHKLSLALALGLACALPAHAQSPAELFVGVNSGIAQTQGVALVLASQALAQKAAVRVLLCSEGGQLAVKDKESPALKPSNKSPKEMLQGLMKAGAKVEVCALFLPNGELKAGDLIEGIGVAKPADVAAYLLQPNVKSLTY
ncbi:DsrE family protein [Sulfuritalea sp.]|uniref:DsrE family protein n=1 Tax=Sulfuritalea sp. TaxID=2480090 RepID=UPI00286E188B|nr:DsrE family protein [Sulfuritalea sp.]